MQNMAVDKYINEIELLLAEAQPALAAEHCQAILRDAPENIEALFLLGVCLASLKDWEGASAAFRNACRIAPDKAVLWKNLGYARQESGDRSEAIACWQRALALEPESAELWVSLASLYVADYAFDLAAACYRRALQLGHEDPAELLNRLATIQVYLGETSKALNTFEQAVERATNVEKQRLYGQNLIFSMHYPAGVAPEALAEAHRAWGERYGSIESNHLFQNQPLAEKRLRVGYVSPDFRMNAVCFFIQPVLKYHDPTNIEVYCYANVTKPDVVTRQLQQELAVQWRDISGLNDTQACELIRNDGIDILVDLAGHGGGNRLPLFALRPAPVQMTWIGYPDTTGLPAIDYRITDSLSDPPGMTEQLHTERLLRLPGCFLCYNPGAEFPRTAPGPVTANGSITFGSMSNFSKITPQLMAIWAAILTRVPGSRLVLRYRGQERERIAAELGRQLEQAGITANRLTVLGHASSVIEQLEGYYQMDIALDTFPYNGTTTTCEAFWMGVPVVTLAGRNHVSRVGVSLLSAVGLSQFVAETPEQYIEKAVALAMNRPLLEALRGSLRQIVAASPLCDHRRFTAQVEEAYRSAWRGWCAGQTRSSRDGA